MDDRFETTFVVQVDARAAWAAITQPAEGTPRTGANPGTGQFLWLPGFESRVEVIDAEDGRCLRVRKDEQPCEDTEITLSLEAAETGTRVTMAQSGFGPMFDQAFNLLAVGWDLIVKDLALYLERGVRAMRHQRAWGIGMGCALEEAPSGLVVRKVWPDGCGAKVGLAGGDHILAVGQVPVLIERDLVMVMRTFRPGDLLTVEWLRGRDPMRGTCEAQAPNTGDN